MKRASGLLGIILLCLLPGLLRAQFQDNLDISFQGAGWYQGGRIMKATADTISTEKNYTGNIMMNTGAVFNGIIKFDESLEGSFGIGAIKAHSPRGPVDKARDVSYFLSTFVNMARVTYSLRDDLNEPKHQFTAGLFSYKYDNNIRNLGLYLIRGVVYPNILLSEFESKEMLPIGNLLGGHMRNHYGGYTQDLLLVSETDINPKFDYSLIYVGAYKFGNILELGGGFNFYHYLPVRPGLTTPSEEYFSPTTSEEGNDGTGRDPDILDRYYAIDKDTTVIPPALRQTPEDSLQMDREWYSNKGVKAMFRFAFDPKPLFNTDFFGPNDLKLYSEVALLGVKSYDMIYKNWKERVPLMVGLGLPTFKLLDDLALEVEYFGSRYMPDYTKVLEGSPVPRSPHWKRTSSQAAYDVKADNWKWSLYASKVVGGHVKLSAQAACDHYRIGALMPWDPTYVETFASSKDWYLMGKMMFFF